MIAIKLVLITIFVLIDSKIVFGIDFKHHNYVQMKDYLQKINEKCPTITRIYSIGQSIEGRDLLVMEISKDPGQYKELKPNFKYIGNMHGNEVVGRETLLYLLDDLCTKYLEGNLEARNLVDTTRIHIMPSMNPDGYERSKEGDCQSVRGRANANGKDLNRNFPDQFVKTRHEIQPETMHVMKWMRQYPFVLSANLHGGSLVANYPFDDDSQMKEMYSASPDDDVFIYLAKNYSFNHPTMHLGAPVCGDQFKDGITNGAQWYNVAGGMQDYNYLRSNDFEITVEMACCKFPLASQLPTLWSNHRRSLIDYIKLVHIGVKGQVKYSNGTGIEGAIIDVAAKDHPNQKRQPIMSTYGGDYYRLLLKGQYEITVTANGVSLNTSVDVIGFPAVVVDFVVGDGSITAQSVHATTAQPVVFSNEVSNNGNNPVVSVNELNSLEKKSDTSNDGVKKESKHKAVKSSRSDNVAAAFVIVTIGLIVCVLAGIVLFRKVKDLRRNNEKGGYAKINEEKFDAYEP